jgi:hypothetical protein
MPFSINKYIRILLPVMLLVLLWAGAAGNSTNMQADSLYRAYQRINDPNLKFLALKKLAHQYTTYLPDTSLFYSYKTLYLGRQNRQPQQEIEGHILISEAFFAKHLIDSITRKQLLLAEKLKAMPASVLPTGVWPISMNLLASGIAHFFAY